MPPRTGIRPLHRGAAIALWILAIAGFARTFFLRSLADPEVLPPLPDHLVVHGVVLTAWFTLLVVQSELMWRNLRAPHKWLGWASMAVVVGVVVTTLKATSQLIPMSLAKGVPLDESLQHLSGVSWGNVVQLAVFVGLVAWAMVARRDRNTHIRLMLIATLDITLPALSRIGRLIPIHDAIGPLIGTAVLFGLMVRDDRAQKGEIHRATRWGFAIMVIVVSVGAGLGALPFGQQITLAVVGIDAP